MSTLALDGLHCAFPRGEFTLNASFTVSDRHIAGLAGGAEAGKTMLLRVIAGLERADRGRVLVDGEDVTRLPPDQRGIGLVSQELALFPRMNVRDNVALALRIARWKRNERRERVEAMLQMLGLSGHAGRRVEALAPAERVRVALARALAPAPRVLLIDEPITAPDEVHHDWFHHELRAVLHRAGTTAVVAARDVRELISMVDDLVLLANGAVLQAGAPDEVSLYPTTAEAAGMLGYTTILQGEAAGDEVRERGVGEVLLPREAGLTGTIRVMAHPSTMLAVPTGRRLGSGLSGVVVASRRDGPMPVLEVALGPRHVDVRWEWDLEAPATGTMVDIAIRPETVRFYGARGAGSADERSGGEQRADMAQDGEGSQAPEQASAAPDGD